VPVSLALTHPIGQKIVSIDDNLRPTIDLFTLSGARLATIQVTNPVCIFRRREVEVVSPTQHSSCQASEYHGQIVGMGWNDIEHLVVILEYAAINQPCASRSSISHRTGVVLIYGLEGNLLRKFNLEGDCKKPGVLAAKVRETFISKVAFLLC